VNGGHGATNVAVLLIELGTILFGLGLLGRIARRFGIPVIPLYLLGGLCFGQGGVLGLSASQEFVRIAADIGVILLLVMLGLEYSASELRASLRTQAPPGVLDGLLNAVPGGLVALIAGWGGVAAVALGGITWVSSSGVIAKMLGAAAWILLTLRRVIRALGLTYDTRRHGHPLGRVLYRRSRCGRKRKALHQWRLLGQVDLGVISSGRIACRGCCASRPMARVPQATLVRCDRGGCGRQELAR
jgi:Sodium/hydrogen exchanger family